MAERKSKEIKNMSEKEKQEKLKQLRMELVKKNVAANAGKGNTKEIKKAIARILTSI